MAVIVFLLGLVLAVAGAASIAFGFPYIRMEFGWAEVISGSVLLSGGIVTLAVASILPRLNRLIAAVERGASFAPMGSAEPVRPEYSRVSASDGGAPEPDAAVPPSAPPFDLGFAAAPPVAPDTAVPAEAAPPPRPSWLRRLGRRSREPDGRREPDPTGPPEAAALLAADRTTDMVAGTAVSPPAPPVAAEERTGDAASADGDLALRGTIDRHHDGSESGATETPPEPPTVVGRYQAGAASYVLFSDGTIEVETETGTHRFGSMRELKTFIEGQGS